MKEVDYGTVTIKLKQIMDEQNISINKLSNRADMQRAQLKKYMRNEAQRIDFAVLARLCYVLECDISEILEYKQP